MPVDNPSPSKIRATLPLLVSAALLALIASQLTDWSVLGRLAVGPALAALACALLLDCLVGAYKWWRVLQALGHPVPLSRVLRVWSGLLPLTFFAPLQSGHALYPLALHRATDVSLSHATEAVVVDKGVSLLGTFALIGVGQWLLPAEHPLRSNWVALLAWAPVALWFVDQWLLNLLRRWPALAERSRLLSQPLNAGAKIRLLALGMFYQSSDSLSAWLACVALGLQVDPSWVFGAFPMALLLSYLPLTFSGFGVREPATAWALGAALTWDQGVWVGAMVDGLEYVAPALAGTVALPWSLRKMATGSSSADGSSD